VEDLKQIPIGFFEDDSHTPVTPETRQAVEDSVRSLRSQGFRVEPFRPRALEQARKLWWKYFVRCGAMLLAPLFTGREAQLSPTFHDFLDIARPDPPLTGDELLTAWAEADTLRAILLDEMRQFPILLMPVCSVPAFRHGERQWAVDGQPVDYLDAMRYTQWFNLLGAPAAVVPIGRSPEGLPIGIQIAGRPYQDEAVLGIAAALERDFGYQPPPMAL
jgi:Asp-tRNA(Asn)/Glu-tRNA(Gln) amidotransferase A subunit family amidase